MRIDHYISCPLAKLNKLKNLSKIRLSTPL
jgi:hypothetical protein